MSDTQLGYTIVVLLYAGIVAYGLITGDMLAYYTVESRDKNPRSFWAWTCINGGLAALSLALLITSLVSGQMKLH